MTKMVQGRVAQVEEVQNPTGLYQMPMNDDTRQFVLSMEFSDGSQGKRVFHSHGVDATPQEGDVLRALEGRSHSEATNPVFHLQSLFSAVNMGNVDINTTQRTHYIFGEEITGVIIENTGEKDALDSDFFFSKLRLDDGTELEITLPSSQLPVGTHISGTVGNSVFTNSHELHSAGFGNMGAMPLLASVEEAPGAKPSIANRVVSALRSTLG